MPELTTNSYAILGLLSIAPMSGYDIHVAVDGSIRHFWPISKTQVYTEVSRLEEAGLVAGRDVSQEGLPDKRVFSLTVEGEQELDRWIDEGKLPAPQFRLPFLLKVLFGHRREPGRTADLLGDIHDGARAAAADYEQFLTALETVPDAVYSALAIRLGQHLSAAIAEWAKEASALVPVERVRIDPRRSEPKNAPAMFRRAPRAL